MEKKVIKIILPYIIVILVAVFAIFPLFSRGLPPTHDGEYHILRFWQFDTAIRAGNIYPRWTPDFNNGYGIPLFNYVYPLPNYVSFILHGFGISYIDSFKLNFVLATLLSSALFYKWVSGHFGMRGGVIAAIFYTFAPYRFVDIYVRGSVGEVWALAFAPGLFWAVDKITQSSLYRYVVIGSFLLAFLIYSHNILALMFFVFILSYAVFRLLFVKKNRMFIAWRLILTTIIGLGLSAPFFVPALLEKKYVTGLELFNIQKHFPDLYQLIIPAWGTGFSGITNSNQMSFQIGIVNLLVVFSISVMLLVAFFRKKHLKPLEIFFIISFYFTVFLMLPVSMSVWKTIPLLNFFQFPWRLLSVVILICAFLAGSLLKERKVISVLVVLLLISSTISYTKPAYYHQRDDNYYLTRQNFTDGTNSPGNYFNTVWLEGVPTKQKNKIVAEEGAISELVSKAGFIKFKLKSKEGSVVVIHTAYFPGWKGYIDEKPTEVVNNDGIINLKVPKGKHDVVLKLKNTPVQNLSWVIFLVSIVILSSYPAIISKLTKFEKRVQ